MKLNEREIAVMGGGCFWCLEAIFRRLQGVNGVESGYAGGRTHNPTYEEVSAGTTGHAETVKINFNPAFLAYRELLKVFFEFHDPTTLNRQGRDEGEQYRSIILYADEEQKRTAEELIRELEEKKTYSRSIVTEVKPLRRFYKAEEYHQNYYGKHPQGAYCQAVIRPKLKKLEEKRLAAEPALK